MPYEDRHEATKTYVQSNYLERSEYDTFRRGLFDQLTKVTTALKDIGEFAVKTSETFVLIENLLRSHRVMLFCLFGYNALLTLAVLWLWVR